MVLECPTALFRATEDVERCQRQGVRPARGQRVRRVLSPAATLKHFASSSMVIPGPAVSCGNVAGADVVVCARLGVQAEVRGRRRLAAPRRACRSSRQGRRLDRPSGGGSEQVRDLLLSGLPRARLRGIIAMCGRVHCFPGGRGVFLGTSASGEKAGPSSDYQTLEDDMSTRKGRVNDVILTSPEPCFCISSRVTRSSHHLGRCSLIHHGPGNRELTPGMRSDPIASLALPIPLGARKFRRTSIPLRASMAWLVDTHRILAPGVRVAIWRRGPDEERTITSLP